MDGIEWDFHRGEMDEPMVDPGFDEEVLDDDDDVWDEDDEWLRLYIDEEMEAVSEFEVAHRLPLGRSTPEISTVEEQMEDRLTVLEKRLPGPPLGPQ
ncbi:hypothetical protein Tco_1202594 [Tanacetum coccineum]